MSRTQPYPDRLPILRSPVWMWAGLLLWTLLILGSAAFIMEGQRLSAENRGALASTAIYMGHSAIWLFGLLAAWIEVRRVQRKEDARESSFEDAGHWFRNLFDTSQDSIFIIDQATKEIIDANPAASKLYGYSREEFLRMRNYDLSAEPEKSRDAVHTSTTTVPLRYHRRKDGAIFPVEIDGGYFVQGARSVHTAFIRDITERTRSEEELRISEARFRGLYDNATVGLYRTTPDGRVLMANSAVLRMLGYNSFEALAKQNLEERDFDPYYPRSEFRAKLEKQGTIVGLESAWRRRDGTTIFVRESATAVRDKSGAVAYYDGTVEDITERKQAEEELRRTQMMLEHVINSVPQGIFWKNTAGVFLGCNRVFAAGAGIESPSQVVGKTDFDISPSEGVAEAYRAADREVLDRNEPRRALLSQLTRPDGSTIWLSTTKVPLLDEHGIVYGVLGVSEDITERKAAEEELTRDRNRLRTLIDNLPDSVYVYIKDSESRYVINNLAHLHSLGLSSQAEAAGKTSFDFFPGAEAEKFLADEQEIIRSGRVLLDHEEMVLDEETGEEHWHLTTKVPLRDSSGVIVGLVGMSSDITERKQAEEQRKRIERQYRNAIEQASAVPYQRNDVTQQYDFIGEGIEELTGIPRSGFLLHTWEKLIREIVLVGDSAGVDFEEAARLAKAGVSKTWRADYRIETATGETRWISDAAIRLFDQSGKSIGSLGMLQDITERKNAEAALLESEVRFRQLSEAALEGIVITDKGTVVDANTQAGVLLGYEPSELIGRQVSQFVAPESIPVVEEHIRAQSDARYEHLARRKDGSIFPVETHARAIVWQGKQMRFTCILDITERRTAEDQRLELERQLLHSQKLESLGVLAGGIAHDFNNLLTAISGNLDLALRRSPSSPSRTNIERALQATYRASDLTREMLAYSGKGRFQVTQLNLNEIVAENADLFRTAISKMVSLNLILSPELPVIDADPAQIQQVVMNLITNASEAIGNRNGVITLTTGDVFCDEKGLRDSRLHEKPQAGKFVYVEVKDTGCGMSEEVLDRLFDPFFTTKFTGRGLGMSAVLGIVKGHQGAIFVESEPNRGTTMKVLFPASLTQQSRVDDTPSATPLPHDAGSYSGTVLVVDDEEFVRELANDMIEEIGFQCLFALDGEEGVRVFREHADEIACVLLDLTMPKKGGVETFEELRRIQPGVRVILSSGYTEQEVVEKFSGTGLSGFIQKPYQLQELKKKLTEVVSAKPPREK